MSSREDPVTDLAPPRHDGRPLVVDLDGSLVNSDTLIENCLGLLRADPLGFLRCLPSLLHGKAAFKAAVAQAVALDPALLPYNEAVMELIRRARQRGVKVFLATAADQRIAGVVHDHLGLFDGFFASADGRNLSGAAKAAALVAAFGVGGFDYVGNDHADLEVWERAGEVYVVAPGAGLRREIERRHPGLVVVSAPTGSPAHYAKALRVHQWIKNILLFVPAVAGHVFQLETWLSLVLGFVAFSLCASSAYLLNDLLDLPNDRQDRAKRHRPFAAGLIPLQHGLVLAPLLLLSGLALGAILTPSFLAALVGYYVLTLAYSFALKRLSMLDVVALSGLYGIRMVAGAAVSGVPLSHWLAAFAMFLFLFLALIKRATELRWQKDAGRTNISGRGYSADDLGIIEAMAAGAGFVSVMVFALYVSSIEVAQLYGHPERLWAGCLVMIYWVGHVLLLTHRGRMHDDPVIFAVTDRTSLACGLVLALIVGASL